MNHFNSYSVVCINTAREQFWSKTNSSYPSVKLFKWDKAQAHLWFCYDLYYLSNVPSTEAMRGNLVAALILRLGLSLFSYSI